MEARQATAIPFAQRFELRRVRLVDASLVLLLAVVPLEGVVVASSPLRIPVYIVALPIVGLIALLAGAHRDLVRDRALLLAVSAWVTVAALSLVGWLLFPPPDVELNSEYGTLRASDLRGPLQLAILLALLAALPLTLALARSRFRLAVRAFLGVGTAIAAYTVYQAYALRWNLPLRNVNNDPLSSYSLRAEWNGIYRPRATFLEPAPLGQYLLSVMAVAGALAVWLRARREAAFAWIATLVLWAGFVVTLSVGAWLGVVPLALTMLIAVALRGGWTRFAALVGCLGVVTLLVLTPLVAARDLETRNAPAVPPITAPVAPPPGTPRAEPETGLVGSVADAVGALYDRLAGRFAFGATETRWKIITHQFTMWSERPILGVGLGAADLYLSERFTDGALPSTYGVWWGTLSETGTLGLFAFLALLGLIVRRIALAARGNRQSLAFPVAIGALGGVLADFTAYLTFGERVAPHVWALAGLGLAAASILQAEQVTASATDRVSEPSTNPDRQTRRTPAEP